MGEDDEDGPADAGVRGPARDPRAAVTERTASAPRCGSFAATRAGPGTQAPVTRRCTPSFSIAGLVRPDEDGSMAEPTHWSLEPHTQAKHRVLRGFLDAWIPIMAQQTLSLPYRPGQALAVGQPDRHPVTVRGQYESAAGCSSRARTRVRKAAA